MKTFLLRNNVPTIKWGQLKDNTFFEGEIPEEFDLAVHPSKNYIIVDVDRHGDKNGFSHLPEELEEELNNTFSYSTKNCGRHYWFKYTGSKTLLNKASGLGIDLRVSSSKRSNGGYVKWHPREMFSPKRAEKEAKETSKEMNDWIESLFSLQE